VGLDWEKYVEIDPSKAKSQLGWEPTTTFNGLVDLMVEADMAEVGTRELQPQRV
jgi:GDPmannose 4,6-dehydratase